MQAHFKGPRIGVSIALRIMGALSPDFHPQIPSPFIHMPEMAVYLFLRISVEIRARIEPETRLLSKIQQSFESVVN